jgi:hypothetical protein
MARCRSHSFDGCGAITRESPSELPREIHVRVRRASNACDRLRERSRIAHMLKSEACVWDKTVCGRDVGVLYT